MKKVWYLITAVVCLYVCFCNSPTDIDNPGTLHGFVTDKTTAGDYIRDAGVELRPSGEKTVTGSDGRYDFTNLKPGTYSIIVNKKGYGGLESSGIIVNSNSTMKRDVQLEREPSPLRLLAADGTTNDITELNFGSAANVRSFSIYNDNPYALEWTIANNTEWITVNTLSGTLSPNGGQQPITVTIDRSKQAGGVHSDAISITSNSGTRDLTISTRVVSLTLNANPAAGGAVSPASQSNIAAGTPVTISATVNSGFRFVNWMLTSGEAEIANENDAATTVIISSNTVITANFQSNAGGGPVGQSLAAQLLALHTNAQSGGEYTIELTGNENIGAQPLSFTDRSDITIRLTGSGGERIVSLTDNGSLFTIGTGVTLILDNRLTLRGRSGNNASLVRVNSRGTLVMKTGAKITGNAGGGVLVATDGSFTMEGGEISGNTDNSGGGGVYVASGGHFLMENGRISGNSSSSGGGIYMANGSVTMKNGEIINNTATTGGGVYVYDGTFTMEGGRISNNTANTTSSYSGGGGVYVYNATFTMSNGEISGNTARSGGGIFVYVGGNTTPLFTKTGGTIYGYTLGDSKRNTATAGITGNDRGHAVYVDSSPNRRRESTAGVELNLDSRVAGAGGGWE